MYFKFYGSKKASPHTRVHWFAFRIHCKVVTLFINLKDETILEARLMTPEATDDSKINSSQDWRQKHSANSFDQSDSISVVGLKPLGVVPDNGSEGALGFY